MFGSGDYPIVLAPNPTNGLTTLTIKTSVGVDILMTSIEGSVMYSQLNIASENGNILLDVSAFPAGMYLVKIVQQGKMYTRKIIRL